MKCEVKEETDEAMAARLQREFDSMNGGRASRSGGAKVTKRKKVRKSTGVIGSDGEERPRKRKAGNDAFNKELILRYVVPYETASLEGLDRTMRISAALSELLGETRLSRPQTVKRIWDHVKERGLQDEHDRRFIKCDEALRRVFHTDRLHMFT